MNDDNPYAPPKAVDLTVLDEDLGNVVLARRRTRFVAQFVDTLIGFVYILPINYLLGAWDYASRDRIRRT